MDIFVIGGGVIGCGVVLDVVIWGLWVGLVECDDFVVGILLRFIKFVYGGVWYLEKVFWKLDYG